MVSVQTCWNSTCFTSFVIRFISHTGVIRLQSICCHNISSHSQRTSALVAKFVRRWIGRVCQANSLRQHFPKVSEKVSVKGCKIVAVAPGNSIPRGFLRDQWTKLSAEVDMCGDSNIPIPSDTTSRRPHWGGSFRNSSTRGLRGCSLVMFCIVYRQVSSMPPALHWRIHHGWMNA